MKIPGTDHASLVVVARAAALFSVWALNLILCVALSCAWWLFLG